MDFLKILLLAMILSGFFSSPAYGSYNTYEAIPLETLFDEPTRILELPKVKKSEPVSEPKKTIKPPTSVPVPSSQIKSLIAQYDWNVASAIAISNCESGLDPTRHNYNPATRDDSWGLYQINLWGANARSRPPASELVKPEVNIAFAYKIYKGQGDRFGTTGGWYNCAKKLGIY